MSTAIPDRFVLDSSVALAWLFLDEQNPYADAIIGGLPGLEMLVPRLWHLEVANVLLVGERRGRSSQVDTVSWLGFLSGLPILVDGGTETRAWSDTINIARQHGLTVYDAAYLELALRESLPLASLDAKLETAATAVGVVRYQP